MAGFVLFTDMKPYFHFLLSSHGWSSDGLPTIEELPVSQATPEKKSTDKSPSRIQDLFLGRCFSHHATMYQVEIRTPIIEFSTSMTTFVIFTLPWLFIWYWHPLHALALRSGHLPKNLFFLKTLYAEEKFNQNTNTPRVFPGTPTNAGRKKHTEKQPKTSSVINI